MTRRRRTTPPPSGVLTEPCIVCRGSGLDHDTRAPDVIDCECCDGTGRNVISRDDAWNRRKRYVGHGQRGAGPNGYEKWPRFSTEVPPEIAALLDAAHRSSHTWREPDRATLVRMALREWLERHDPEPPVVDATVDEDPEIRELNEAVVEATADEDPEPEVKQLKQGYHPR